MRHKLDWRYLAPALSIMLFAVVATTLIVFFSYSYHTETQTEKDLEQARYQDALAELKDANDDKRFVMRYSGRFKALESEGVFVAEQRVDWVDSLNTVISAMKLPNIKYEFSPQRPADDLLVADVEHVRINASPLKVEMNLLHEQDMLTLLDRLEREVKGRFLVERCEMKRAEQTFAYRLGRHNLGVSCDLRWLTLSPVEPVAGEDV